MVKTLMYYAYQQRASRYTAEQRRELAKLEQLLKNKLISFDDASQYREQILRATALDVYRLRISRGDS